MDKGWLLPVMMELHGSGIPLPAGPSMFFEVILTLSITWFGPLLDSGWLPPVLTQRPVSGSLQVQAKALDRCQAAYKARYHVSCHEAQHTCLCDGVHCLQSCLA